MEETQKSETDIEILALMKTGKILAFEWSLSTKLDFKLEFSLQIAVALAFITEADATLDLFASGEKQGFCVEVVLNGKKEFFDFKSESAKNIWIEVEELEFEDCSELKELTAEL